MRSPRWLAYAAASVLALGGAACGEQGGAQQAGGEQGGPPTTVAIDGSSTVAPFAQAAAELYREENPNVQVTVGTSGTGGGFEKFCRGETQISNASRPIEDDETAQCRKARIGYKEIQVASDGISVATNKALPIDCMKTDQLRNLWSSDRVKNYRQLDPKLPDRRASLFGAGTDSGTFDFFTEEVNGEEGKTRKDYQPSEDDNVLVQGVAGDPGGLGYFGFSYFEQNQDKLNLVGVDNGQGCVKPSTQTIQSEQYKPLSRPIFMYPSEEALKRPEVKQFMDFILQNHERIAQTAKIVPMSAQAADKSKATLG